MKKRILILLISTLMVLGVLTSCNTEKKEIIVPLSEEVELEIRRAYVEKIKLLDESFADVTEENVFVREYAGTYNGAAVVIISCSKFFELQVYSSEVVAGVTINYPDSARYEVWHNGKFYSLQSAYDASILSVEDLQKIAQQ